MNPRQLLDALPDDAMLPASFVRQLVAEIAVITDDRIADLSVDEVARALGRASSTVRAWLHSGELPGYKLRNREWRVRAEDLREFQDQERMRHVAPHKGSRSSRSVNLASWREVRAQKGAT